MDKFIFPIGAQVYCRDGKFGKLVKVVVEPETQCVKSLIVEKGFLCKQSRLFPVSLVSATMTDEVHLWLMNKEWANYPAYKEEEFEVLPMSWEERPLPQPETLTIQTAVQNLDPYETDTGAVLAAHSNVRVIELEVKNGQI